MLGSGAKGDGGLLMELWKELTCREGFHMSTWNLSIQQPAWSSGRMLRDLRLEGRS